MATLRYLLSALVLSVPVAFAACGAEPHDTPSAKPASAPVTPAPVARPSHLGKTSQASTGVCDSNPPTSTDACINAIKSSGGYVNDIFKDANGLTATQLPLFGKLFNRWPGCDMALCAGCNPGTDTPPYDCPGEYTCVSPPCTFASVSTGVNSLDHNWGHPCRLAQSTMNGACPTWGCIADGTGGQYNPWEGMVFDLGGPSNKVAIFAMNDHGPQPCESAEYTVYLTDNPFSKELITNPTSAGADPMKWNRAVLSKIFTQGWFNTRAPDPAGHAACGDTADYAVEEDAMVTVYSMPCGITFRYAAIIAGNDGLDFPSCAFDSSEAELDAVAGLTESGAAVCPDVDGDHFVDCACPGAPAVCDCNDADPSVHPGAPEKCDDTLDKNCDGKPGACTPGLTCYQSTCLPTCSDKGNPCPFGATCSSTTKGMLCVPTDCTVGSCPAGSVCNATTKKCVPACSGVQCPVGEVCEDGACIDLCKGVVCPGSQTCVNGVCKTSCSCFAGDIGCDAGQACDKGGSNLCVPAPCKGVTCAPPQHCAVKAGAGTCVDLCFDVICPNDGNVCHSQQCDSQKGCAHSPVLDGTSCADADMCNGAEVCKAGTCTAGTKPSCDDMNPCTTDTCDAATGCKHTAVVDGVPCATGKTCDGPGHCKTGACNALPNCDDGNACTTDTCDAMKVCQHAPISGCTGTGGMGGAGGAAGKGGASGAAGGAGAAGKAGGAGASGAAGAAAGGGAGKAGASAAGGTASAGSSAGGKSGAGGTSSAGAAGKAGSTGSKAGAAGAGAAEATPDSSSKGGCGCRTAEGSGTPSGIAFLGIVGAALARRRRRAPSRS